MESEVCITIPEFFKGKNVLLTGVTGFIGQLLLEKLLRSCSDLNTVYLLVRPKKGLDPEQRLEKLLAGEVFQIMKKENPTYAKKIQLIEGDVRKPGLGLSENAANTLIDTTHIIIHSAATVRFDAQLREAVEINILGTRGVVNMAEKMGNLVALVHVSTAYAFCPKKEIEEKVYQMPISYQEVIDLVMEKDDATLKAMSPKLLGRWPNTYTFTKALAENLFLEEGRSLPKAIVRPSIVSSTWREPVPGWCNNLNGPIGIIVGASAGVMRTALVGDGPKQNVIPADVVVNIILAVTWYIGTRRNEILQSTPVFHATADEKFSCSIEQVVPYCVETALTYPSARVFRYPGGSTKRNYYVNKIAQFLDHTVPAALVDGICWLTGRETRMLRLYRTIHSFLELNQYFVVRKWQFDKTNTNMIERLLSKSDKKDFFIDMSEIHAQTYWQTALINTRKFVLREDYSTLPQARTRLRKLQVLSWIENSAKTALVGYFVYYLLSQSTFLSPIWNETVSTIHKLVLGYDEE